MLNQVNLRHAEVSYIIEFACHWSFFPILPVLASFWIAKTPIFSIFRLPVLPNHTRRTYVHQGRDLITGLKHAISPYCGIVWVLFYSPVICNPCPPTYGDGRGIVGLMCGAMTFWVSPQCRLSARLVILCKYTPVEFTLIKSKAMTLSRSQQCRASRAVMDEKLLSPLFPVSGGAVVTNDWWISISSDFLWKSALNHKIWAENCKNINKIGDVLDPGWETNASQVCMWFLQLYHDVMNI